MFQQSKNLYKAVLEVSRSGKPQATIKIKDRKEKKEHLELLFWHTTEVKMMCVLGRHMF